MPTPKSNVSEKRRGAKAPLLSARYSIEVGEADYEYSQWILDKGINSGGAVRFCFRTDGPGSGADAWLAF